MSETYRIEIKRRPWFEWLLWAAWLLVEIFLVQNAIASSAELEPRAGLIFWASAFVLLIGAVTIWFLRRGK